MRRNKEIHPDSLMIMGIEWTIKYVDKLKDDDGEILCGDTDIDKYLIRISTGYHDTDSEMSRTILHETLHAILRMTGQNEMLSEKQEEAIVRALEQGLSQLYRI